MMDDRDVYFYETAKNYYDKALNLSLQYRKAAAQEALRDAKSWLFKCPGGHINTTHLTNCITNLENKLY